MWMGVLWLAAFNLSIWQKFAEEKTDKRPPATNSNSTFRKL
jgi:hypothetical protein